MLFLKLSILLFFNTIIEFLPISSTAHFLLISQFFNLNINNNLILSFSQLSITFYLLFYFRYYIIDIIKNIYKKDYILFCMKILITMLPTIFIGLLFYNLIKKYTYNNISIAIFLILGSILMFIAEKKGNSINNDVDLYNITYKDCIKIGFLQMFSLIPGISRSATTISGGLLSGFNKNKAILFSFFISIPISFCASVFDIYKNINYIYSDYKILVFSFVITFIFSFLFVDKIIRFLQNNKLYIFIYYRIIFALLILIFNYVVL